MVVVAVNSDMDGECCTATTLDKLARNFGGCLTDLVMIRIGILKGRSAIDPDGDLNARNTVDDGHCCRELV